MMGVVRFEPTTTVRSIRWPMRVGAYALAAYGGVLAAWKLGLRKLVVPDTRGQREELEPAIEALRARLGRNPTEQELIEFIHPELAD